MEDKDSISTAIAIIVRTATSTSHFTQYKARLNSEECHELHVFPKFYGYETERHLPNIFVGIGFGNMTEFSRIMI
jgi:hypothetical protein